MVVLITIFVTHFLNDVCEDLVKGLVTGLLPFSLALVLIRIAEFEVIVAEAVRLKAVSIRILLLQFACCTLLASYHRWVLRKHDL